MALGRSDHRLPTKNRQRKRPATGHAGEKLSGNAVFGPQTTTDFTDGTDGGCFSEKSVISVSSVVGFRAFRSKIFLTQRLKVAKRRAALHKLLRVLASWCETAAGFSAPKPPRISPMARMGGFFGINPCDPCHPWSAFVPFNPGIVLTQRHKVAKRAIPPGDAARASWGRYILPGLRLVRGLSRMAAIPRKCACVHDQGDGHIDKTADDHEGSAEARISGRVGIISGMVIIPEECPKRKTDHGNVEIRSRVNRRQGSQGIVQHRLSAIHQESRGRATRNGRQQQRKHDRQYFHPHKFAVLQVGLLMVRRLICASSIALSICRG